MDRRKIKIIDGMEIGNTHVQLDNGVKLAVVGEGKYHTLGNPKERWAEVAEVRILPDGEYGDGELLGWTPAAFLRQKESAYHAKRKLTNSRKRKRQESCVPQGGKLKSSDRSSPSKRGYQKKADLSFTKADSPIWNRAAAPKS